MVTIVVETYESGRRFPIVVHHFNGITRQEAERYYAAHLQSDAFLRSCKETGIFQGRLQCRNVVRIIER